MRKEKCEICGKEREELICHYKKAKHHYCSKECYRKGRKINNKINKESA